MNAVGFIGVAGHWGDSGVMPWLVVWQVAAPALALAAIGVDARLSPENMETLRALPEVTAVRQVELD